MVLFIYYLFIIYLLFIYYLFIIYLLFIYYLFIIYLLFIYYLFIYLLFALPIQGHNNNIDRDDVKIVMIHVFDNACL